MQRREGWWTEDIDNRKRRVIRTLQRAAKAAQADLVVLAGERQASLVAVNTGGLFFTQEWDGGSGYLFRRKK